MRTTPVSTLIAGVGSIVMGTLAKYRALPFFNLKDDTVLSGGKRIPTEEVAASLARQFYGFGIACLIVGLVWLLVRVWKNASRAQR